MSTFGLYAVSRCSLFHAVRYRNVTSWLYRLLSPMFLCNMAFFTDVNARETCSVTPSAGTDGHVGNRVAP